MSYPFYHLETSGFWHLVSVQGEDHQNGRTISSIKRLSELYQGATLDADLFNLLNNEEYRKPLRGVLITHYFDPSLHQQLWDQATINKKSEEYYKDIIKHPDKPTNMVEESPSPIYQQARDQGFRKAIVQLYEHRCAMCGIRILTTEGHTVVEAAHIIPWCQTHNDSPQNGVSLCKLCHWSFDEGLMGIDSNYKVMVSPSIQKDKNFSGHIQMLFDREIFKPEEYKFWPKQENLEHHRDNTYRKT
jgi:putative restriction endonuclease